MKRKTIEVAMLLVLLLMSSLFEMASADNTNIGVQAGYDGDWNTNAGNMAGFHTADDFNIL